ncbi:MULTISPECIES: GntR family transcriptional regulator [Thermodesulfovibrio]|jgi:GntR family transcriptional regulator|uniref:GntR family transcriptional regulator n=1 Tax=Thermodesulfovibrio TaxID=28261 RepID=UPI00261343C2|nr:GntR family transcriptional regulator [Thermodesulfovibrio sp.]
MVELISRDEHEKLYLQLFEILKRKIENKEWTSGMQIPTEDQLCKMFNVSRATVRNAVLELVRQGYLVRQQGKGTFVSSNYISEGMIMTTVFKKLWVEDDTVFSKELLAKTVMMPVGDLSKELEIPENRHIIYIKVRWLKESEPSILQESFIPFNVCPHLIEEDVENQSIIDLFEKKYSIKITKVFNYFDIVTLNKEVIQSLNISQNAFAIEMIQKVFSGNTVVLLNRLYKKNDGNKLFIAFQRKAL